MFFLMATSFNFDYFGTFNVHSLDLMEHYHLEELIYVAHLTYLRTQFLIPPVNMEISVMWEVILVFLWTIRCWRIL